MGWQRWCMPCHMPHGSSHDWELPWDSNIFQVLEQKHDFLKRLEFLSIC